MPAKIAKKKNIKMKIDQNHIKTIYKPFSKICRTHEIFFFGNIEWYIFNNFDESQFSINVDDETRCIIDLYKFSKFVLWKPHNK